MDNIKLKERIKELEEANKPKRMELWGLFDSEGYIDTTEVRNELKSAFTSVPSVSVLGLKFSVNDVEPLVRCMEG